MKSKEKLEMASKVFSANFIKPENEGHYMTTFYEFISQRNKAPALTISGPEGTRTTSAIANRVESGIALIPITSVAVSSTDAEQFGRNVAQLVTSDGFLKELSDVLETPMHGEEEDEFVSRCKTTLFKLMDKHLIKK